MLLLYCYCIASITEHRQSISHIWTKRECQRYAARSVCDVTLIDDSLLIGNRYTLYALLHVGAFIWYRSFFKVSDNKSISCLTPCMILICVHCRCCWLFHAHLNQFSIVIVIVFVATHSLNTYASSQLTGNIANYV